MRMSRRLGIYGGKKKTVKYKGAAALGNTMYNPATAKIGDYAIFVGINSASAVNRSLTVTELSGSINADQGKGASLPSYAVFLNGYKNYSGGSIAYDSSLTSTSNFLISYSYFHGGVAVIGNYAIWAGGINSTGSYPFDTTCCDNSLTIQSISDLSEANYLMAYGTTSGTYAIFYGNSSFDAFDSSLSYSHTALTAGSDTTITTYSSVDFNGKIICPQKNSGSLYSVSGWGTVSLLSASKVSQYNHVSGTSINNQIIVFAGGSTSDNTPSSQDVYVYDKSFTQSIVDGLSQIRIAPGAVSIGNVALFGGGSTSYSLPQSYSSNGYSGTAYNTIDAYEFS